MKDNEVLTPSLITTKNKKHYTSPKIEVMGDIKDATRGGGSVLNDAGAKQGGNVPSQPVGT